MLVWLLFLRTRVSISEFYVLSPPSFFPSSLLDIILIVLKWFYLIYGREENDGHEREHPPLNARVAARLDEDASIMSMVILEGR